MEKQVLVRVLGRQYNGQESEEVQVVTTGEYYLKNGSHYIIYEEMMEGPQMAAKNVVRILRGGRCVRIIKRGAVNASIQLEQGQSHQFVYSTPFGDIAVSTKVEELTCEIEENRIFINAVYAMDINYEYVAHNLVQIEVTPQAPCGQA